MAELTLVDLAKRTNNKDMLPIAEVLEKKMPMLKDGPWVEANQLTGHVHARRVYLPTGEFRSVNQGVAKSITQVGQFTEHIGLLEDRSEVDEFLIDLAPAPKQFRYDEDIGHVEGLGQTMADTLLYASLAATPLRFDGIATRYGLLANANVWGNGDATGASVTSAYIIQWGNTKVHFIYPRNKRETFVQMIDKGLLLVEDGITTGDKFWAWVTQFKMNMGLVINDLRCIQRIANIGTTTANHFDPDLGIKAINNMVDGGEGAIMYVNATVLSQLEITAKNAPGIVRWIKTEKDGDVLMFKNVPVKLFEKIKDTETVLV